MSDLQFSTAESDDKKKTDLLTDDCVSHVLEALKSFRLKKCHKSSVNINSYNFNKKWNFKQIENVTELKKHAEECEQFYSQIDTEFVT